MTLPKLDNQGLIAALCRCHLVRVCPMVCGWSPFAVLAGRFLVATAVISLLFSHRVSDLNLPVPFVFHRQVEFASYHVEGTTAFQMAPGEVTLLLSTSPICYRLQVFCGFTH